MFAVDAEDISKICVNHPLHTYPFILMRMVSRLPILEHRMYNNGVGFARNPTCLRVLGCG